MNREEYRCGLWKKKSQKGTTYCTGKFKIANKEYYLTLFNNDKKGNEKAPDFQLFIRDSINTLGKQENENKGQKNTELGQDKTDVSQVYADFGNEIEYSEDDLPF